MSTSPDPDDEPGPVPVEGVTAARPAASARLSRADALAGPVGRLDAGRCSVQARVRGDSAIATAAPAQRWLLIEQPGPWGRDALLESRFDADVAVRLAARARTEDVRVLLVRRPGDRLADSGRRWAYGDSRDGREGLWWSVRSADADLLDAPWDGSVGEPTGSPTYLVCTHGGHDACCALRGRPLARQLPAPGPADVWECSHLGGDRFAANVLVLPSGFYYGQVPGDGAELVAAHDRGQVALPWLRGRAGLPAPVQAAQHHARRELGLLGIHDLPPLDVSRLPAADSPADSAEQAERWQAERWQVTLGGPDGAVVVTVESRLDTEPVWLTCRAVQPSRVRSWHSLSLTLGGAPLS